MTSKNQLKLCALSIILAVHSFVLGSGCSSRATHEGENFAVIAYCNGPASAVDSYPVELLTHVQYSFLHVRSDGSVPVGGRDSANITHLVSLKSRNAHLKVLLSVGGWGGCKSCSGVFASGEGRHQVASTLGKILERFGADGIDIDWEYPAIAGYPGHPFGSDDRHNFTLLIEELRSVVGDTHEVSFAAGGFTEYLESSVEWNLVMPLVDRVNLMTYDLVNASSTVTGHHTPLFSTPSQAESVDHAVRYLDSVGVPHSKIVIGAAFYARMWDHVADQNNGLYQSGTFKAYVNFKEMASYYERVGGMRQFWDSVAQAPYAYSASAGLFATFDDPRSIDLKTRYALRNRLGGIMFWELSGDRVSGGLLEAISRARTEGQ
ncbi:MAG TPA: glycoside hydrolase family 18 protein [Bacteroidota bacterium]|nr:glycoside hydrolase family 18 protein [Bacteroidota bacterium]